MDESVDVAVYVHMSWGKPNIKKSLAPVQTIAGEKLHVAHHLLQLPDAREIAEP